jgi:hypothetical protein
MTILVQSGFFSAPHIETFRATWSQRMACTASSSWTVSDDPAATIPLNARSRQLPHLRLRLLQPEPHVHLAVHRRGGGEVLPGVTVIARAPVEVAEAECTWQRTSRHAHRPAPSLLGSRRQRQGRSPDRAAQAISPGSCTADASAGLRIAP